MSNVIRAPLPNDGLELQLNCGMTIFAYRSTIDGKFVVEIETGDSTDQTGESLVEHDQMGIPQIRVMINEAIVADGEAM